MRVTPGPLRTLLLVGTVLLGPTATAQDASAVTVEVTVRSGETGQVLPGMELSLQSAAGEPSGEAQTDDLGVLKLARPTAPMSIRVANDGLAGWLDLTSETSQATLHLLPPRSLAIQVVDAAGRPLAGLPVRLRRLHGFAARTSPHGIALIPDASALLGTGDGPQRVAEVVLDRTQHAPAAVSVKLTRLPHGPLSIVVPQAPSLTVRVVGADAGSEASAATAYLEGVSASSSADERERLGYAAPVKNGIATFPWVPDGLHLEAVVVSEDPQRPTGRTLFRTPSAGVTVRIGRTRAVFTGTITGPKGEALAGRSVHGTLQAAVVGSRMHSSVGAVEPTSAGGAFRVEFDLSPEACAGGVLLLLVSTREDDGRWSTASLGRFPLAAVIEPRTELGALVLDGGALLVSGRAAAPDGTPVPHLQLVTEARRGTSWRHVVDGRTETRADGTFEVHGTTDASELRLHILLGSHYLPEPLVVAPGAHAVDLRVRACGGIRGSVRDNGDPATRLQLVFLGPPAGDGLAQPGRAEPYMPLLTRRGRFRYDRLRPGTGRLEIRRDGVLLVRIDDLVIEEGTICNDPRLQDIELPNAEATTHTLTVHDAEGHPLPRVRVRFRAGASKRGWSERETRDDGTVRISVGDVPTRVAVVRPGHAAVIVEELERDTTVVLRALPVRPVQVRVQGLPDLSSGPFYTEARLVWCGRPGTAADAPPQMQDPRNYGLQSVLLDAQGRASLDVWEPGVYAVQVLLLHGSRGGVSIQKQGSARVIVASDGALPDTLVDVDTEQLRRAMQRTQGR